MAAILIVGFAQMFHTVAQLDCDNILGGLGICSIRESYRLIYYLLMGEPVVDLGAATEMANTMTVLVVLFTMGAFLLGLSMVSLVILVGSKWDFENVALESFWEPKLTFVLFTCRPTAGYSGASTMSKFENAWTILTNVLSCHNDVKGTYWYACFARKPALVKGFYWLVAAVFVPLWFAAGLLSFGLLWPPQIRRRLFSPTLGDESKTKNSGLSSAEFYAVQVSSMRNELSEIRDMTYERSNDVQREVRELKEILHLATSE